VRPAGARRGGRRPQRRSHPTKSHRGRRECARPPPSTATRRSHPPVPGEWRGVFAPNDVGCDVRSLPFPKNRGALLVRVHLPGPFSFGMHGWVISRSERSGKSRVRCMPDSTPTPALTFDGPRARAAHHARSAGIETPVGTPRCTGELARCVGHRRSRSDTERRVAAGAARSSRPAEIRPVETRFRQLRGARECDERGAPISCST